ncbi:hypothetical protein ABZW03_02485 [Kitasatospora sp. NPDC004799]|uniref:hypothetical protein n=1 Tax=Kitasatospora sp. NPDC004799 TaxID=3154460 RepID=UPI0033BE7495
MTTLRPARPPFPHSGAWTHPRHHAPHPPPLSLVGPYVYSYDVSASPGRSATASRSIPGMRPSYDAEHPHSATPIYDELYSEYRRLFRALPGDRSGEEDLKFTGFAVRDGYPLPGEQRPYPPQQQAFHTLAGQVPGLPQFMPSHQHHGSGAGLAGGQQPGHAGAVHTGGGHTGAQQHAHAIGHAGTHVTPHAGSHATGSHSTGNHSTSSHSTGAHAVGHHHGRPEPTAPTGDGPGHATAPPAQDQPAVPAAQFTNGQGWVAAGYLGAAPPPVPVPAPAPPAPPAPAPVMGTVAGLAPTRASGGRHRQMLSLPPGPAVELR